jgi:hypothetical protein
VTADTSKPDNEILEAAKAAKRHADSAAHKPEPGKSGHWNAAAITVGVGIGSAAIAAALLYANRGMSKK